MLWTLIAVGIGGVLMGMMLHVGTVVLLSAVMLLIVVAIGAASGQELGSAIVDAVLLVVVLQLCYMVGLGISRAAMKARSWYKARVQHGEVSYLGRRSADKNGI